MTELARNPTTSNTNVPQYLNIIENSTVLSWLKQTTKSEVMIIISLLGDNLFNYEKLYGEKPLQDSQNPNLFYWNVNYQSIAYTLVCDKEKGNTTYYVQYNNHNGNSSVTESFVNDTEFGTYIISYLSFLLESKLARNLT